MTKRRCNVEPDLEPLLKPLSSLTTDEHQARAHDNRSIAEIKRSLDVHGQKKPIVVEASTGQVKAGNGTLLAARELGWTHIAAVSSADAPAALREYAIRDNRSAELSAWDVEALQRELDELSIAPELLGWQGDELERLVEGLGALDDDFNPPDPETEGAGSNDHAMVFSVVVDMENELALNDLVAELRGRGLKCRVLIS